MLVCRFGEEDVHYFLDMDMAILGQTCDGMLNMVANLVTMYAVILPPAVIGKNLSHYPYIRYDDLPHYTCTRNLT